MMFSKDTEAGRGCPDGEIHYGTTLWDKDLLQQAYYIQPPVISTQAGLSS